MFEPGSMFEIYQIIRHTGKGYLAKNTVNGSFVCIKFIHIWCNWIREINRRSVKELQLMLEYDHPNIPHIHDIYHYDETTENGWLPATCYVRDYVQGITLKEIVAKRGALSEDEAINIFIQVLDGIQYLHSLGTTALLLEPNDIIIEKDGKIKIVDVGIRKHCVRYMMERKITMKIDEFFNYTAVYSKCFPDDNFADMGSELDVITVAVFLYEALSGKFISETKSPVTVHESWVLNESDLVDISSSTVKALKDVISGETVTVEKFKRQLLREA